MSKNIFQNLTNKKLIIIMTICVIVFGGVLLALYLTFGVGFASNNKLITTNSSNNKTNQQFGEDTLANSSIYIDNSLINSSNNKKSNSSFPDNKSQEANNTNFSSKVAVYQNPQTKNSNSISNNQTKPDNQEYIPSKLPETSRSEQTSEQSTQITKDDTFSKEIQKLPEIKKISYAFDQIDQNNLTKYVNLNVSEIENKIISKLKDDKNSEILAIKVPVDKITQQTKNDFPNTFEFSSENRQSPNTDKIFLYYTSEKRTAYLGDFIQSVHSFEYENKTYWLTLYYGELLISKPNFGKWRLIYLPGEIVQDIQKKNDFEFNVIKNVEYDDYSGYKTDIISPQKYILDGIFDGAVPD